MHEVIDHDSLLGTGPMAEYHDKRCRIVYRKHEGEGLLADTRAQAWGDFILLPNGSIRVDRIVSIELHPEQ